MTARLDPSLDAPTDQPLDQPSARAAGDLAQALEPVRLALLADARSEAEQLIAAARAAGDTLVAEAEQRADAAVEQARRRAVLAGAAQADQAARRAHRVGHRAVLHTEDEQRRQLVDRVRSAVAGVRTDARYPELLDHLEQLARTQLGDGAVTVRDPEPDGGVVATDGPRRVDYRLPALADRALRSIADQAEVTS